MTDITIPKVFDLLLNFNCPAEFWPALEYDGDARYVGIYWEPAGDEASWYDGRRGLCGANWGAYIVLMDSNFPMHSHPARWQTGSSDSEATHWIVVDREKGLAWLAPRMDAERFLILQWLGNGEMPAGNQPVIVASVDMLIDSVLAGLRSWRPPTQEEIAESMVAERQRLESLRAAMEARSS